MKRTVLGRTGLEVSILGFGAAPIGLLNTPQERVDGMLQLMLDSGVNFIDTAANYAGSEQMLARAIGHRRDQFILASKCGNQVEGTTAPAWSGELIRQTVDRALKRLATDRLDIMLLHSCDLDTLQKGEALGALVEAQRAGKIRFGGYSGDNHAAAWAAAHPDIAVLQTSINIVDQAGIELVLPVARHNKVGVIAKRPIANAAWRPTEAQPGFYGSYAQTYHDRLRQISLTPADLGFTGPPERAWPEIALRFTLAQPGVHTAIVGTTSIESARANIAAAEKGPLDDEQVQQLRAAFDAAEAASGSIWMGQV
jgi:aryl-alcohol dehydrogenase-like predicted oxidoreductase